MDRRRATDIQQPVVIRSGRRSGDTVRTYGIVSPTNKDRGCFGNILISIGWFILICGVIAMCSMCYWSALLFA